MLGGDHYNYQPITDMAQPKKDSNPAPSARNALTSTVSDSSAAPPAPDFSEDLGIPHHLQDKRGFCGAACMMMLLGYHGKESSQGELMRRIKFLRDETRKDGKRVKPASESLAWHASPEEIAEVLSEKTEGSWRPEQNLSSEAILASIDASLKIGFGAIALVWSATLNTGLPHWVVVGGRTLEVESKELTGYWILDPTAAGRPDGGLRYESLKHEPIKDSEICPCQSWKDSQGNEQTAQRIWVSKEKLEELLDDGAVKGNGLRYAIVKAAVKFPPKKPLHPLRSDLRTTVEEKIAAKKTEAEAEIFASKFKSLTVSIEQTAESQPEK